MRASRANAIAGSSVLLAVMAIYVLRLNSIVGLMVDDAWYVVLAKALAEGGGFRLISSATTPIQPLYPPGFPAILSLVFRIVPEFPRNVWLLKSVSIAAMGGVGLLTYVYLQRCRRFPRELAICGAIAVTVTPAFVFLATSTVMSECVFTLAQLAAVLTLHRSAEPADEREGRNLVVLAAVLCAVSVLIRSAAVGLVLAALIWFAKERLWRRAAVFATVAVVCVLPWTLYARIHAPTADERAAHGGAVVYEYFDQLSMRWAGAPVFGRITLGELPSRMRTNLVDVVARDIGGIFVPTMFRAASESGEEVISLIPSTGGAVSGMGAQRETMAVSLLLSGVVLLGFAMAARDRLTVVELMMPIALGIILLWPFWSFRFVLPLTPFLIFYFVRGVQVLAPRAAGVALLSMIGLNLFDHGGYLLQARSGAVHWVAQAREVDAVLDWIDHGGLRDDGVLVTTNPGLVFLRTGRRAIASDHPIVEWNTWKRRGVRYVAALYPLEIPAGAKVLFSAANLWIVQI